MTPVSVVVITYNEESNIATCLQSVKWADEIVVLDAGSTDRTVEIAIACGAKVATHPFHGFGDQKNRVIELATHRWILLLDADESLSLPLVNAICALLKQGPDAEGYAFPRRNYFLGRWIRHGGWYPDYSIRLFDRTKGRVTNHKVHERIIVDGTIKQIPAPIEHRTHPDVTTHFAKLDRYAQDWAEEKAQEGVTAGIADWVFRPVGTFIRVFILRVGCLDGKHGLLLACSMAIYTFRKYTYLWERSLRQRTPPV